MGGPAWITFPDLDPTTVVEVPLVRRDGDPRPWVQVWVGEEEDTLARVALSAGSRITVGRIVSVRLGLDERGHGRWARIPWMRVGDLVLNDVRAELVAGDELVLGVEALSGVDVALSSSRGLVLFGRRLSHDGAPAALPGDEEAALADVTWDAASGLVFARPAAEHRWTDADAVVRARLEQTPLGEVVERARVPDGDPGDLLARLRWGELASARFADGDGDGASEADRSLALIAGDRCEERVAIGLRALRLGLSDARERLRLGRDTWRRWQELDPTDRSAVRAGRPPTGVFAVEQSDGCARSSLALPGTLATFDDDPWTTARFGVDARDEGALRAALAGGADAPLVRLALADLADREGRGELRDLQVSAAQLDPDDPHPLATALWVHDRFGPLALADTVAAGVVLGEPDPEALERARVTDPGWASACAAAGPDDPALTRPEADCLAAALLWARRRGDEDTVKERRAELVERWPDVWLESP